MLKLEQCRTSGRISAWSDGAARVHMPGPGLGLLQGYTGLGHSSPHPQEQRLCSSSQHWEIGSAAASGNLLFAHTPSLGRWILCSEEKWYPWEAPGFGYEEPDPLSRRREHHTKLFNLHFPTGKVGTQPTDLLAGHIGSFLKMLKRDGRSQILRSLPQACIYRTIPPSALSVLRPPSLSQSNDTSFLLLSNLSMN